MLVAAIDISIPAALIERITNLDAAVACELAGYRGPWERRKYLCSGKMRLAQHKASWNDDLVPRIACAHFRRSYQTFHCSASCAQNRGSGNLLCHPAQSGGNAHRPDIYVSEWLCRNFGQHTVPTSPPDVLALAPGLIALKTASPVADGNHVHCVSLLRCP